MQTGAAYIRVSTEDQLEFSPDAQKRAVIEYAKKNDIQIFDDFIFIDEGISGRTAEKRPAFMQMIAEAKKKPKPFDIILVHKFDRFARNREDSVVFKSLLRKECGIKVVSITEQMEDDKFSIILESMLEAMAEYYSLNLADEVRKGLFEKARRGEHIGKAPYGYDLINQSLVIHPFEYCIVKEIFHMYVNQQKSLSAITRYLNQNCIRTKQGHRWRNCTIGYILKNPIYSGLTRYNYMQSNQHIPNPPENWIIAQGSHKPLIDETVFQKAQERLKHTSISFPNIKVQKINSWCQHLLYCSECHKRLCLHSSNQGKYFSFECPSKTEELCSQTCTWSNRKIENLVLKTIETDTAISAQIRILPIKEVSGFHAEYWNQKEKKLAEKKKLIQQAYLEKIDTLEEYKQNKNNLIEEELFLQKQKSQFDSSQTMQSTKQYTSFADLFTDISLSPEDKNNIAKHIIEKIYIDLNKKEIQIIYSAS